MGHGRLVSRQLYKLQPRDLSRLADDQGGGMKGSANTILANVMHNIMQYVPAGPALQMLSGNAIHGRYD